VHYAGCYFLFNFEKGYPMQCYFSALGRILLAQVFLLQITMLILSFFSNPDGYLQYQAGLGSLGLASIFAPLIILVQLLGGLALLLGYKTKVAALSMAIYAVIIAVLLHLPLLQYLAIAGGLLMLHLNSVTAFSLDNLKK
jgi:putative oxidoreductase